MWIIIDSKVYDLSKFGAVHPGGLSVLLDGEVGKGIQCSLGKCQIDDLKAGQDATETFFGLHRYEVLQRPQYARLQIGTVMGEKQTIFPREVGALSKVPYAEPTWLTAGFHSPYFRDVRNFTCQL